MDQRNTTTAVEPKSKAELAATVRSKGVYAPPRITVYGTIAELTNGSAGAAFDLGTTKAV